MNGLLMVRFFHVVYIVGTTWDPVLITARLVPTTRDSGNSRRHDFHDQESRDVESTWLSHEHEQTTQKWRLKRPTRVLHQYYTSQHGKVRLRKALLSLCTCARSATHYMIKTHTTRAHEFTSHAHDLHNMKKTHHKWVALYEWSPK